MREKNNGEYGVKIKDWLNKKNPQKLDNFLQFINSIGSLAISLNNKENL